ncbi:hypothetical protein [Pseudomonas putida]|uniref:Lipoprotein n=1 Tax=Pseudomonas putida TaxID=303 RepID=A0AAW4BY61_PSEPU|nr:hypothetical protein [Pseudomonas putida]MBF8703870.1 hypothetical protein [Pseudomonas putida]MBF8738152.1 hypothetical protein [Pseudomonas putida]
MKLIEPLSSALLVTGCVYVAGISQYSALMHCFGVNPAFSQPSIDKIFYDGGLITFELFVKHFLLFSLFVFGVFVGLSLNVLWRAKGNVALRRLYWSSAIQKGRVIYSFLSSASGTILFVYLIFLTFSSYNKGVSDGGRVADMFLSICHAVELKKDGKSIKGCAFSKDRDSIWFYTIEGDEPRANSKLLSELDQIIYFDPAAL